MLDEQKIFEDLERGDSIFMDEIPYVAVIFTKKYAPEGLGVLEIRQKIEEWARKHNKFILTDINYLINRHMNRRAPITKDTVVKITRRDLNYIIDHVKTAGRKRILFALIVYGKIHHDNIGDFRFSVLPFTKWIEFYDNSNLYNRYFPWLIENQFIEDMTKNYEIRGFPVDDGTLIFKMKYLLIKDPTETILEIRGNNLMEAFKSIDWSKRY